MSGHDSTTTTSLLSSVGLALLGTTCCALPILLVILGAGGAMASLVSALPWLAPLSKYKAIVFLLTASAQGYAWWRLHHVSQCGIADAKQLRWQRRILWSATILFGLSMFAAYAAYPIVRWLQQLNP